MKSTVLMFLVAAAAAAPTKQNICHVPPGNPSNVRLISVGSAGATAHLNNHNDWVPSAAGVVGPGCLVYNEQCAPVGEACSSHGTCVTSWDQPACDCDAGFASCPGGPVGLCSTNTNEDANNCGACGVVCSAQQTCLEGVCTDLCQPSQCDSMTYSVTFGGNTLNAQPLEISTTPEAFYGLVDGSSTTGFELPKTIGAFLINSHDDQGDCETWLVMLLGSSSSPELGVVTTTLNYYGPDPQVPMFAVKDDTDDFYQCVALTSNYAQLQAVQIWFPFQSDGFVFGPLPRENFLLDVQTSAVNIDLNRFGSANNLPSELDFVESTDPNFAIQATSCQQP